MGRQSAAIQLDVADIASFDSFIAQLSQLLQDKWGASQFNFLVNNAGINRPSLIPQTEEAAFDELLNGDGTVLLLLHQHHSAPVCLIDRIIELFQFFDGIGRKLTGVVLHDAYVRNRVIFYRDAGSIFTKSGA